MTIYPTVAQRFTQAYLEMVRIAHYRPGAPSDGMGSILLSSNELRDPDMLASEAEHYGREMNACDQAAKFTLFGCTDYRYNRVFVYLLNACTLCFSGDDGRGTIRKLLQLALQDLEVVD